MRNAFEVLQRSSKRPSAPQSPPTPKRATRGSSFAECPICCHSFPAPLLDLHCSSCDGTARQGSPSLSQAASLSQRSSLEPSASPPADEQRAHTLPTSQEDAQSKNAFSALLSASKDAAVRHERFHLQWDGSKFTWHVSKPSKDSNDVAPAFRCDSVVAMAEGRRVRLQLTTNVSSWGGFEKYAHAQLQKYSLASRLR
jgi:hypothetical protein